MKKNLVGQGVSHRLQRLSAEGTGVEPATGTAGICFRIAGFVRLNNFCVTVYVVYNESLALGLALTFRRIKNPPK